MAHHGGGPNSPPRAHRPRAPIMSAPAPLTAPLAPLRPQPPVTLTAPRPENERSNNEYVENPFTRSGHYTTEPPAPPRQLSTDHHHQQQQRGHRSHRSPPAPPVVKHQPAAAANAAGAPGGHVVSFRKDPAAVASPTDTDSTGVICPRCERCQCDMCQRPRPLPQTWICNNHCLCSADAVIDYASCLCCVKGLFYHCYETDGGGSCADDPCGCGPERRAARWSCLAALTCVLPCLLLYWPLRGAKRAIEVCYARYSGTGCRCQPPLHTPEKRLLDNVPDF